MPRHVFGLLLVASPLLASADAVVDWNIIAGDAVTNAAMATPTANRALAIAHVAASHAVAALPDDVSDDALDAAVAAAFRTTLVALVPTRAADVEREYAARTAHASKSAVAAGEGAAREVLRSRERDVDALADDFRVEVEPGRYVPTTLPAVPAWATRQPWFLARADALRPAAPPALGSAAWASAYEEVRTMGARDGSQRTQAQTDTARFWEATLPPLYHALARELARQPGRELRQNARFFARLTCAMDDALIAVFDAKYHYRLWRPITAIRNGDRDGNDATPRDARWLPLIETPMHPEYPCAHCAVSAAVATVLEAEARDSGFSHWTTTSTTAGGASREWQDLDAFTTEVANARIWAGVHYRFSAEAGTALGRAVGRVAVAADPP